MIIFHMHNIYGKCVEKILRDKKEALSGFEKGFFASDPTKCMKKFSRMLFDKINITKYLTLRGQTPAQQIFQPRSDNCLPFHQKQFLIWANATVSP